MFRPIACFAIVLTIAIVPVRAEEPAALDISGCWSGYWISCSDGHRGPLQATLCKINDNCYQARFKGRFWVVFPFRYTTTLHVVGRDGDKLLLAGEQRLGPVMGTFRYSANVSATDFDADYSSRLDHGKFVMTRVGK